MTTNVTRSNFGGSRLKNKTKQLINTTRGCFHRRPGITIKKITPKSTLPDHAFTQV